MAGFMPADSKEAEPMKRCATLLVLLALLALIGPVTEILPPSSRVLTTVCNDNDDCPTGQLCCYPCGVEGCNFVCMTPVRGRCPFFP